jgi:hypothetical protein
VVGQAAESIKKRKKNNHHQEYPMKKLSILTLTMIALATFMAITVWAANPHFISCGASGVNANGTLRACFKIAGLGDNQLVTVTASADSTATYACRNNGQQCPNAANKVDVHGTVTAQGTFPSGKNGSVDACLTLNPPATTLTCPGGQRLVLVSVSYSNVTTSSDASADTCTASPGTFAQNFFPNCP